MEVAVIIIGILLAGVALSLLVLAFKFLFVVAGAMSLLDYIFIGVGVWMLTHRTWGWHAVFVIVSIFAALVAWGVLSSLKFGAIKIRPFALLGALFSAITAAVILDRQILHPTDPLLGQTVAEGYDTIWRVFVFIAVISIIAGIRFVGSILALEGIGEAEVGIPHTKH